jgi:chloramphenicol 3-O phosphotransferase
MELEPGTSFHIGILSERERERGNRPIGSAKKDYETIHTGKIYDIELHSTDEADANVEKPLVNWRKGHRSSSFSVIADARSA